MGVMSQPTKTLTIHQPWAWAIAAGHKTVENRSWTTSYRGPLLIHAGRSRRSLADGRRFLERLGFAAPEDYELPFGAIVAIAWLVECASVREVVADPFAEGPWCWILQDVRPVRPVPTAGSQGLFGTPADVVRRLEPVGPEGASRLVGVEPPPPAWRAGMLPLH